MAQLAETAERDVELGELAASLGFLLRIAQIQRFEHFFEAFGETGLTPGAWSILLVIGRNPGIRQGVLARALHVKPAHMTKTIRSFEDRGLVARHVPDGDRRAVELSLTPQGEAWLTRHAGRFEAHESKRPARLTAQETDQLARLLRKMTGLPTDGKQP